MIYLIHTYPKRLWYVNKIMIPDLLEQGIPSDKIKILNDTKGLGNLKSFVGSLKLFQNEDIWHLQDDVLISKNFYKYTQVLGRLNIVITGFYHKKYNWLSNLYFGFTKPKFMNMSFPCIFIPKRYNIEFINYIKDNENNELVKTNKNDDLLFYNFMVKYHYNDEIYNCYNSLVDHVDYLLGGSSINPREKPVKSSNFNELNRLKELERRIERAKNYSSN